ncbi:hypothetical protein BJF88_01375 [Cellulosimicrobium sp. CUA-896]|nr:hypothetical protein BJF88_01375 [Cellulosimicrobium sp. CUA-896]
MDDGGGPNTARRRAGRHAAVDEVGGDLAKVRVRTAIARTALWCGRVLLAASVVLVVVCRATRDTWADGPFDDAGFAAHGIPSLTMVVLFVTALTAPLTLLPVGSAVLVRVEKGGLTVPTVLGRRSVPCARARGRVLTLPGGGFGLSLLVVSGPRGRWVVVGSSSVWGAEDSARPLSTAHRAHPAIGWLVLAVCVVATSAIHTAGGVAAGVY